MPKIDNLRLYQVLGLSRNDASADDVKKAYRKTSVRVHPDRNRDDPHATIKMQEVQFANAVLSDPQLRGVYDSYGEQSLEMYRSYLAFAVSEEEGSYSLPVADPVNLITGACVVVSIAVGLLTATFISIYLKVQGDTGWSLAALLIPLWLIDAIALGVMLAAVKFASSRGWPLRTYTVILFSFALFIAWQILLVLRVDDVVNSSSLPYGIVFIPLYLLEGLLLAYTVYSDRPTAGESEDTKEAPTLTLKGFLPYPLGSLLLSGSLYRATALVLIALRFDTTIDCSWALVLLPLWLYLALEMACTYITVREPANNPSEIPAKAIGWFAIFSYVMLDVFLIVISLYLDNQVHSSLPFFIFFFVLAGLFFCISSCAIVSLRSLPPFRAVDVPESNEYGGAAAAARRSGGGRSSKATPKPPDPPTESAPLISGKAKDASPSPIGGAAV